MFTLRTSHLNAIRESFLETLAERCAGHLRTNVEWAVQSIPDEILLRMVRSSIRRALAHGMKLDTAIIAFVHIAFVVAPNFDEHRRVSDILRGTEMVPDEIPFVLGQMISVEEWQEVRLSSDPAAWGLHRAEAPDGSS